MKTLPKLTLSALLLSTLTAHDFYIPDLFGAYWRGGAEFGTQSFKVVD